MQPRLNYTAAAVLKQNTNITFGVETDSNGCPLSQFSDGTLSHQRTGRDHHITWLNTVQRDMRSYNLTLEMSGNDFLIPFPPIPNGSFPFPLPGLAWFSFPFPPHSGHSLPLLFPYHYC